MAKKYLYHRIEEKICSRIADGTYPIGEIIPGTKELAMEFECSTSSVDQALLSLVEKGIIERKKKGGTRVLPTDVSNVQNMLKGDVILILHESYSPGFWGKAIQGISTAVESYGRQLLIKNHRGNVAETESYVRNLDARNTAGLIFVPIGARDDESYFRNNIRILKAADDINLPLIQMDRYVQKRTYHSVTSTNYEAAMDLTERLLGAGSKNPVCLSCGVASSFMDREKGFMEVLKAHSLPDIEDRLYRFSSDIALDKSDQVVRFVEYMTEQGIDGILAINENTLTAVIKEISRTVPAEKVPFLVNFDDPGNVEGPLIASAIEDAYELGMLATELLLDTVKKWPKAVFQVTHPFSIRQTVK